MFITFEGSEGSGKTSQLAQLVAFLLESGYTVLTPREPGGTAIGEQVRSVLFDLKNTGMLSSTEVLLFQASRAQLVGEVIRPYLASGGIVLCDRYADSTLAYQGYGRQLDLAQLRALIDFATGGLKPDLTLLLDVAVEVGLQRRSQDGNRNRLDILDVAFYQRVRQGYLELARLEPQRWVVIDAGQPSEAVQADIRRVVLQRLG
jgi:dTMP kinase